MTDKPSDRSRTMNPLDSWKPGDTPWSGWVLVSPKRAEEWLRLNVKNYRRFSLAVIEGYARTMESGSWQTTHQAICFCWDEEQKRLVLGDGQHRLAAVLKAGKPQLFFVVVGLPLKAMRDVDTQRRRTAACALNIVGFIVTPRQISIARGMAAGPNIADKSTLSNAEIQNIIEFYRGAIIFADRCFSARQKMFGQAMIAGIVARAYYHAASYSKDNEAHQARLQEFAETLRTGLCPHGSEDSAAVLLREWIIKNPKSYGSSGRLELAKRVQAALDAFLSRRELKRLFQVDRDLFPLPKHPEPPPKPERGRREA